MFLRISLVAALMTTLAACQMETGGGGGFNPGIEGSGGFNPGSGSRPPFDPDAGSSSVPGLELAKTACLREGARRGLQVRVLAAREMRGGAEVILLVGPGRPPANTQRVTCFFDYGSGRATIS